MAENELPQRIEAVRRFARFYTRQIGVLQEGLLHSPFSLTEARVLYELAHREQTTASEIAQDLKLDGGYLSRILRSFQKRGLIHRKASQTDARQNLVSLTDQGKQTFLQLNEASQREVEVMLSTLTEVEQNRLVNAMQTIENLLGTPPEQKVPYILRTHQIGDMGWVIQQHGMLYSREYGWDEQFEALVAEIASRFIRNFDPKRERCWIAEKDGVTVGSAFLVRHPEQEDVAKLRLLIVKPKARGLGIGKRLVQECSRFAQQAGYKKITLWTNSILSAARKIYEDEGYKLTNEEQDHSFGHDQTWQTWELEL